MKKNNSFHWYILSVRGGREEKIIEKIQSKLNISNLESRLRKLKVIKKDNKALKGLIFCQVDLDPEVLKIFYEVPGVIGFLDHAKNSPKVPNFVAPKIVEKFLQNAQEKEKIMKKTEVIDFSSRLKVGDLVKIMSGPFNFYEGKVVKINEKAQEVSLILESDGKKNLINNISLEHLSWRDCQKILN